MRKIPKNAHVTVAFCEKMGFVKSESGDKLMEAKAVNRRRFFQKHGSMAAAPDLNVELVIENESFDKW